MKATESRNKVTRVLFCSFLLMTCYSDALSQTTATWRQPVDGVWDQGGTYWSTPVPPNNGTPSLSDTYDVLIDPVGNPYTLTIDSDVTLSSLTLDSTDVTLEMTYGADLTVLDPIDLRAGTFVLDGGKIHGGTITSQGGSLKTAYRRNGITTLDRVTLDTDLTLNDRGHVDLTNGLTLANGHKILMTSSNSNYLSFIGTQSLSGEGEVIFGSPDASPGYPTLQLAVYPKSTLTIGPDITVRTGDRNGTIGGTLDQNAVINHGLISAPISQQTIEINPTSFQNHGTIEAINGGHVILQSDWTNHGTLRVKSGTMDLGGTFSRDDIGTLQFEGGLFQLTGTMDNTGGTFNVDNSTGSVKMFGGTIVGGSVNSTDGKQLEIFTGTLDNVTVQGNVTMPEGGWTHIRNDLTLDGGTVQMSVGKDHRMSFQGNHMLRGHGILQLAGRENTVASESGTLTIGPDVEIQCFASRAVVGGRGAGLINNGRVTVHKGQARIEGDDWVNNGTIEVKSGASFSLMGSVRTANIGTIVNDGGTVWVSGTIDNTGDVLDVQTTLGELKLNGGTLKGGRLVGSSPTELRMENYSNTFDNLTVGVDLVLSSSNQIWVNNGLTLDNATIDLNAVGPLQFSPDGQQQLLGGNGEIRVTGGTGRIHGEWVTIGEDITVRATTNPMTGTNGRAEVKFAENYGTLTVDAPGATLQLGHDDRDWDHPWINHGVIQVVDGVLILEDGYTTDGIGTIEQTGGEVQLAGRLDNTDRVFRVGADRESWRLGTRKSGVEIQGGRIETDGTMLLRAGNQCRFDGVTLAGDVLVDGALAKSTAGSRLWIENGLTLDGGSIVVQDGWPEGKLYVEGEQITGTGEVILNGRTDYTIFRCVGSATPALVINPNITVRTGPDGAGKLGLYGTTVIDNRGTISAQTPDALLVVADQLSQKGLVQAVNEGQMEIRSEDWTNEGRIYVDNGTIRVTGNSFANDSAGIIDGHGTIEVLNTTLINEGTISPGNSFGSLTIDGNLQQSETGKMLLEVGGVDQGLFDTLTVNETATLGGSIEVLITEDALFRAGDQWKILSADVMEGQFEHVIIPTLAGEPVFDWRYVPDGVELTAVRTVPEPSVIALLGIGILALSTFAARRRTY